MTGLPQISPLRSKLDRAIGLRDSIKTRLSFTRDEIKRLENEEALLLLVSELFRKLIDQEVTIGVQAVERLQTEGLQSVFNDQDLSVKANIEVQRGKVSVDLITTQKYKNGMNVEGMCNDSFGGAVSTVQSILLRIIIITRRGLRPLLLLDETLPAIDPNYITNMGQFLTTLCNRLGMDILSITHNPAVVDAANKAYRIVKKEGSARFEVVR